MGNNFGEQVGPFAVTTADLKNAFLALGYEEGLSYKYMIKRDRSS